MGHRHVLLVSLALLLVATTHAAGGHAQAAAAAITQQGKDGVVVGSMTTRRSMIGSAPPSCEGKCGSSCVGSSCEAVLVPIEPPQEDDGSRASSAAQRQPSWYDDSHGPDYKPVAWRCECVGATTS